MRCFFKIIGMLAFCLFCAPAFSQGKKILVIESYHESFLWDQAYRTALKRELGNQYTFEFFAMNTKRLPESMHAEMAQVALQRAKEAQPDLIVLGDDAAIKFLALPLDQLAIPIVFLGLNNSPRAYGLEKTKNIRGVVERPVLRRSLAMIRQVKPDVSKILVLFDDDLTSRILYEEIFLGNKRLDLLGIQVDVVLCRQF